MKLFSCIRPRGLKTFDEVLYFLSHIEYINRGGCGISTLAMYRWLKKHGKTTEQTAFYFLDNDYNNHNNNSQYHTNEHIVIKASSHVVLFHNDQTIDCDGFKPISDYSYQIFEKSEGFLVAMINNVQSWNRAFSRSKDSIANISKRLGIDLSDIDLEDDDL